MEKKELEKQKTTSAPTGSKSGGNHDNSNPVTAGAASSSQRI
jgi:hypothetical protein